MNNNRYWDLPVSVDLQRRKAEYSLVGGSDVSVSEREAVSALRWWIETGVDVAIQENPRNWFESEAVPAQDTGEALAPSRPAELPDSLEGFQDWLATDESAPLFAPRSKAVRPSGEAGAEIMILADPPTREELAGDQPVGGEAAQLMERMLAAIGMAGQAYVASLACFHSPAVRLTKQQLEQCASAARRHVALVGPKRLLLFGEGPTRALLGKPLIEARGHVHAIEGVRTIATFHPRQLLKRPSDKALAWKDLLLLSEDAR